MKHIHIRAPLLSISGYGVHARQIARWALSKDYKVSVEILPWGNTPWYSDRNECDGLIDKIMECSSPLRSKPDYSFQVMLPNEWDNSIANINFGVSAVVETTVCSEQWVHACKTMNHVIVPSEFSKKVLVNSGLKGKRVTVIPESFIDACKVSQPTMDLQFSTSHNFLMLGQMSGNYITDRKNTAMLINLFCQTFANRPDVGLIVKTNSGGNSTIDRYASRNRLKSIIQQVRKGPYPKIYFLHGYLKDEEVASLYQHPKVRGLLSLTHGEGFGLPLLEAAACGLPVLATNWSAHTEFLNKGPWTKVPYKLETIPQEKIDHNIFVPGAKWANPEIEKVPEILQLFEKNNFDLEKKAKTLQKTILNSYSFEKISAKYDKFLRRYES